jgi:cytochrome c biogenesis protein
MTKKAWAFFSSAKLTIAVLITLAATSVIGTVVEQNREIQHYYIEYGERWAGVITTLALDRMYNSPWFMALIVALVGNILVCTLDRFPAKWKSATEKKGPFDPAIIERLSTKTSFNLECDLSALAERASRVLSKKRYKMEIERDEGGLRVYARKGASGRFGSDVVHAGLLIILLGSLTGSILGYRDFKAIVLGEAVEVPKTDSMVRLDNFWIDYYPTGAIRQYNSLITVIEGDTEVLTKQIWVNEPLYYKGVRFYQSSYGTAWNRIREAEIALKRKDTGETASAVSLGWNELKRIPGSPYSVKVVEFVSDFAYDEEKKLVFSKSGELDNPAAKVEVYEGERLISRTWLFFNYPGLVETIPGTNYEIILSGFRPIPYSGISMTKDPGTNIVWVGSIVMGVGFILAFFVYHRRVWLYGRSFSSTVELKLGGIANKNQFGFEKEFEELASSLKAATEDTG